MHPEERQPDKEHTFLKEEFLVNYETLQRAPSM